MASRSIYRWLTGVVLCLALRTPLCTGADTPATQPDAADDRLSFLTLQLSSVETSITTVNNALRAAGYKAAVVSEKATNAAEANELMDRKGGGPVPWKDFYGKTSTQFTRRDVLGTPRSVPRPNQFDYIYRANNEQIVKANQEIAALGKRVDALLARRQQLEAEQSALWATITFESITNKEIPLQPLYRYQLEPEAAAINDRDAAAARLEVLQAAALLLRTTDRAVSAIMNRLDKEQGAAYLSLRDALQKSHERLQDTASRYVDAAGVDPADAQAVKDIVSQSRKMQSLCRNICDAHRLALERDAAGEEQQKQLFRGQLQQSLVDFSDVTSELDQSIMKLAERWHIRGKTGVAIADEAIAIPSPGTGSPALGARAATPSSDIPPAGQRTIDLLKLLDPAKDAVSGPWAIQGGALECEAKPDARIEFPYAPPAEYDFRVVFVRLTGNEAVDLICAVPGRQFSMVTGGMGNTVVGFSMINGRSAASNRTSKKAQQWIVNGQRYTVEVKVRKEGAEGYIDGRLITSFRTGYGDVRLAVARELRRRDTLGLAVNNSHASIESAEIREINGQGQATR